jgi:hypothetical protein
VVLLVTSYDKNGDGSLQKLSKQQIEYLILATSQPYLQAKLCLAWLSLFPDPKVKRNRVAAKAYAALQVFAEQWEKFRSTSSSNYQSAVQLIMDFVEDLKVKPQSILFYGVLQVLKNKYLAQ